MDHKNERGSIRLSFDGASLNDGETLGAMKSPSKDSYPSKSELYELYKMEIDELVLEERKKITMEYDIKFKKELSIREKELKDGLKEREKHLDDAANTFKNYVDLANRKFNDFCNDEIIKLDALIVNVVMEVLYKITGNSNIYKDLVISTVKDSLLKKIADIKNVIIKVSKEDYVFFKRYLSDQAWIGNIKVDDRLIVGQIVFEDGFSMYECGLVDQLDLLRAEFVAALRNNYE